MNEEFLTQFQLPPREAFADALKARLSMIKGKKPTQTLHWIGLGFATICVVFTVLFASVPSVRAITLNIVREIAGLNFDDSRSVNPSVVMAHPTPSNLDKISREISRTVHIPAWIPTGFTLQGDPYLSKGQSWPYEWEVLMVWVSGSQKAIQLSMAKRAEGSGTTQNVGPAMMEEVTVKGEPAAFARGFGYWRLIRTLANQKSN
jgi:hypothetical protein